MEHFVMRQQGQGITELPALRVPAVEEAAAHGCVPQARPPSTAAGAAAPGPPAHAPADHDQHCRPRDAPEQSARTPAEPVRTSAEPGRAGPDRPCPVPPASAAAPAPVPRTQVRRMSVRDQVLDALRAALADGTLAPGEVYSAPVLGDRFGVSATPVREAMQQLACEGAVAVVPNRGFRVVGRSPRELAELAEVRALIEVPVVLRLVHAVPAGRWDGLRQLAEDALRPAGCGDSAAYALADRAFHRALLGLAGNQQLVRTVDELHRRAQWPRTAHTTAPAARHRARLLAHAAQHTALLDALAAQDTAAVETLVRNHYATPDD